MARLDQDRQAKLEPERMFHAKEQLFELEIDVHYESECELRFMFNGSEIKFFPYSGWHTGKTIKDGRGLKNLLKQLA